MVYLAVICLILVIIQSIELALVFNISRKNNKKYQKENGMYKRMGKVFEKRIESLEDNVERLLETTYDLEFPRR